MTLLELSLAMLALLLTPGPTNTLLFVAGTERGWTRALHLIPAELAGYLATTLPLAIAGGHLLQALPVLRPVVAVLAGLWVAWLALRLWRLPAASPDARGVGARDVLVTTLLNPKALIFGLVLLPAPAAAQLAVHLGLFAGLIVIVAALWAGLGALVAGKAGTGTGGRRAAGAPLLRRIAALWLAAVSVSLIAKGIGA